MIRLLNWFNRTWNKSVFKFHDIATKTNIKFMVTFSIWAHDKLVWELPDRLHLISGVPVSEHKLIRELELAKHQSQYFMDYAEELQNELFRIQDETPEPELVAASIDG
tara:strand:- start:313 stop:636 length:324 start_codon:yes stop_codon:yes gene_type:complete